MSAPAPPQMTQPGAVELMGWNRRRQTARNQYAQGLLQNQFSQDQADLTNKRNVAVQGRNQSRTRSTFGDSYAERGIYGSGVYGRGLRDWYVDMAQQRADLQSQYLNQVGGLDLQRIGLETNLADVLGGIDQEEMARRADLAAQIRGVM